MLISESGRRVAQERCGKVATKEGRYKACLVDSDTYLLHCCRYIGLDPVRAGMVHKPDDYRWSSFAANALGRDDRMVRPRTAYLELGSLATERQRAYRLLFDQDIDTEALEKIRLYLQRQHALGSDRFRAAIEKQLARTAGLTKIDRPRKARIAGESAL